MNFVGGPRAGCLAALLFAALAVSSEPADCAVHVVDVEGDTLAAARQQAISTALQAQVRQLIAADRAVSDDELIRNSVITTFNGFVESFEELEVNRREGIVLLKARVAVSESGISNYIFAAVRPGAPARVDGQSLFAEVSRQQQQAGAHRQLVERSLAGYPSDAWELLLRNVTPLGGGKPGVRLQIDLHLNEGFRTSMGGVASYLQVDQFPSQTDRATASRGAWRQMSEPVVCPGSGTCHVLENLDYLPSQGEQSVSFLPEYPRSLMLSFMDDAGEPIDLGAAGMAEILGDGRDAIRSDGSGYGYSVSSPHCISVDVELGDRLVRDATQRNSSQKFAFAVPRTSLSVTSEVSLPEVALARVRAVSGIVVHGGHVSYDGELTGRSANGVWSSSDFARRRFLTDIVQPLASFDATCRKAMDGERYRLREG